MSHKNTESLIVIHNPNSTNADHFAELQSELRKNDIRYTQYETESADTEENIAAMQAMLPDSEATIIGAAGDGTAMQLLNAILRSRKQHTIKTGFVNYGGFGDIPSAHNDTRSTIMDVLTAPAVERRPLTIDINGEYWRDAPAYATLGFTALAAMKFDTPESRQSMKRGPKLLKRPKSIMQLGQSYFEHRNTHLPAFHVNDDAQAVEQSTDIIIANNPYVGGIIQLPDSHYDTPYFGVRTDIDVSRILPNIPFGLKALAGHAPFDRAETLQIAFEQAAQVPIQTEGEAAYLRGVHEVFVYKDPTKVLRILHPRTH